MNNRSTGFKIGLIFAGIHLCLVLLAFVAMIRSHSSTAGLVFIWFSFLDAPLDFLFPRSISNFLGLGGPIIQFGLLGSGLWFLIPWLIDKAVAKALPNRSRIFSGLIIVFAIPFILVGFYNLSFISSKQFMQAERPEALKKTLDKASSDFLSERVVFTDNGYINSIKLMDCRPGAGREIIIGMIREVVFLKEDFQVSTRLSLGNKGLHTLEPLYLNNAHSCGLLAYWYQAGAALFDPKGKELIKFRLYPSETGIAEGIRAGDMDGDGRPEYALYHRYREGIHYVTADGKTKWQRSLSAVDHVEIGDVDADGKAEIIYNGTNSNIGTSEFTILDETGAVEKTLSIQTHSPEFALIGWPDKGAKPNILLTEDDKIRIVDMAGDYVAELEAPGCKTFGDVKATTVRFRNNEPEYLAVRKSLHPDLTVLYVYKADGTLVYQKTDVTGAGHNAVLAAVPTGENGAEKLLVGSTSNYKAIVFEYSPTR